MKYHIYKRTVNGKKSWYCWYYDENGNQIRKSCKAKTKKEAEIFVEKLIQEENKMEQFKRTVTFRMIATEMFKANSDYLKLMAAYGHEITELTIKSKLGCLNRYILPEFGEKLPGKIKTVEIENWIMKLEISNNYRNLSTFRLNIVYKVDTLPWVSKIAKINSEYQ